MLYIHSREIRKVKTLTKKQKTAKPFI